MKGKGREADRISHSGQTTGYLYHLVLSHANKGCSTTIPVLVDEGSRCSFISRESEHPGKT